MTFIISVIIQYFFAHDARSGAHGTEQKGQNALMRSLGYSWMYDAVTLQLCLAMRNKKIRVTNRVLFSGAAGAKFFWRAEKLDMDVLQFTYRSSRLLVIGFD